ncbi:vegetative cell wall protein gp1-like [Cornus florida]|uniref:vegetative cell wall protein gp1-like n=1 Tax=Cornus florida TaxID=4283 RepID=UPI00289EC524|nr:vegetative cell wall protein gp1-like [Cornus florida]
MARLHKLAFVALVTLMLVQLTVSADLPEISPSPAPKLPEGPVSPPPDAGSPSNPSPSPDFSSPPSPPPSDSAPGSSPTPSPTNTTSTPAPAPTNASDVIKSDVNANANAEESKESSGGLKVGQKAGIALGVIVGAGVVVVGIVVYKKRQQNIQRSQFGYAARREIL